MRRESATTPLFSFQTPFSHQRRRKKYKKPTHPFDVVLLRVQPVLRDKQREVRVLHARFFNLPVEPTLNRLPDRKRPRPEDVAAADVVIRNHLRGEEGLGVPVGEVGGLGRGEAELGLLLLGGAGGASRAGYSRVFVWFRCFFFFERGWVEDSRVFFSLAFFFLAPINSSLSFLSPTSLRRLLLLLLLGLVLLRLCVARGTRSGGGSRSGGGGGRRSLRGSSCGGFVVNGERGDRLGGGFLL